MGPGVRVVKACTWWRLALDGDDLVAYRAFFLCPLLFFVVLIRHYSGIYEDNEDNTRSKILYRSPVRSILPLSYHRVPLFRHSLLSPPLHLSPHYHLHSLKALGAHHSAPRQQLCPMILSRHDPHPPLSTHKPTDPSLSFTLSPSHPFSPRTNFSTCFSSALISPP